MCECVFLPVVTTMLRHGVLAASSARRLMSSSTPRFRELLRTPTLAHTLNNLQIFTPNAIQAEALPLAQQGDDILVCAQTGSGKTLCFLLPMIDRMASRSAAVRQSSLHARDYDVMEDDDDGEHGSPNKKRKPKMVTRPEALILVPSFELGRQICTVADMLTQDLPDAPEVLLLSNGNRFGPEKRALQTGAPRLIVATPARLLYHLDEGNLVLSKVRQIAIDEVDAVMCATDGNRRQEIELLLHKLRTGGARRKKAPPSKRQYILAAATVSEEHAAQISEQLGALPRRVSHRGILVPTLRQQFHFVRGDKEQELLRLLERCYETEWLRDGATLVFCRGPRRAQRVFDLLSEAGLPAHEAALLHGDNMPGERTLALSKLNDLEVRVLVCTDVAARGLDLPLVNHVIMYDMPRDFTTYIHRAGRTARAGKPGLVTAMVKENELEMYKEIRRGEAPGTPLQKYGGRDARETETKTHDSCP